MSTPSTPEAREQQALEEVGRTDVRPWVARALGLGFVLLLAGGLGWHVAADLGAAPARWPAVLDATRLAPVWDEIRSVAEGDGWPTALRLANERVGLNIADYEADVEERSPLADTLVPWVNLAVTARLGGATESVHPGRDGWLFYRPDIEYLTTPGFLDPERQAARRRASPGLEPDPSPALLELRDALAARGIALLVVPAPVKPVLYPDRVTARYAAPAGPLQNRSYADWIAGLREAAIPVVDLTAALWTAREAGRGPLYLRTDTHWTPAGVRVAAEGVAEAVERLAIVWTGARRTYTTTPAEITNRGDTLDLLRLPPAHAAKAAETIVIDQVRAADGSAWQPDPAAEILVLGDSFANIYSLPALGWGAAAGLAEQLSLRLGRPIDTLRQNDDGSYATRQMLAAERMQGRDRLAGTRLVIYQFAVRELAFGDWRTGFTY